MKPESGLRVRRVESKKDWGAFIELPFKIYKNEPNWVPPLRIAVRDVLDVNKNPFFKHAFMCPLLAERDGEVVGRIVGVIDEAHNKFQEEQTAFFGFFESIDDPKVSHALFEEVRKWVKPWGMKTLRGPMNPSTNHECGLLVEGFDQKPFVMMTYNPPYYLKLLEAEGLTKSKDLWAWVGDQNSHFSERLLTHSERLKQNHNVVIRPIDMKRYDEEVEMILDIYNNAWEKNWGFVPMNQEEFRHMAKDMKAVLDPRILLIAEVRGKPAAFGLALPDVNQVFSHIRDGKLMPFGLIKLLWLLKGPMRKRVINRCRILTLGVKQEYRELGLGALMYTEYLHRGPKNGYPVGEASWILEDNRPMNKGLQMMDFKRSKVYRIFDAPLGSA